MFDQDDARSRPFAGYSGKGVRIAIIDSGIHPRHPHIAADTIATGVAVLTDGSIVRGTDVALDRLGHGTAVTAAIQEKAPGAVCLPVRVFRDSLKTSAAALITAIRWAVDQGVDLVNLSLGSSNAAHAAIFEDVAEDAGAAGVLLVAAREAHGSSCYPGALPQVLGVGLDWDCPRERFRLAADSGGVFLCASGYPRPIPGVPQQRNLYGVSFAVAQMTGFAALALESLDTRKPKGRLERVRQALLAQAS
ncbi:MAG: S8 family serine peptidase [Solimonas sp.]